jgi:hypothetical protein
VCVCVQPSLRHFDSAHETCVIFLLQRATIAGLLPSAPRYAASQSSVRSGLLPASSRHVRSLLQQQRKDEDRRINDFEQAPFGGDDPSPQPELSPGSITQRSSQRRLSLRMSQRRLAAGSDSPASQLRPSSLQRGASPEGFVGSMAEPGGSPRTPRALPRLQLFAEASSSGMNSGTADDSRLTAGVGFVPPARVAVTSLASPLGISTAAATAPRRRDQRGNRIRVGPSSLHLAAASKEGASAQPSASGVPPLAHDEGGAFRF